MDIAGFRWRMCAYAGAMYPPLPRLATASLLYVSFGVAWLEIQGLPIRLDPLGVALGIWDGFWFALILRLMDELKDREIDKGLFPERPLPSGRVRESDIRWSLVASALLFILPNAAAGPAFWSALALLAYSLCMFRYFFLPLSLRRRLVVNLATHNPVSALMLLHFVVLLAVRQGVGARDVAGGPTLLLLLAYWSLFLGWEISRKIRYRAEETAYQTYSQVFGARGTVAIATAVYLLGFVAALAALTPVQSWPVYVLWLSVACVMLLYTFARFLSGRMASGKELRRAAERYAAAFMLAAPLALFLERLVAYAAP